jgi:hypothetical protein
MTVVEVSVAADLPSSPVLPPAAKVARRAKPNRGAAGGRTKFHALRLSDGELARLQGRAAEAGLSVSSYLRASALGDAGPRARRAPTIEKEALGAAIAELNRVGNNVNQIARALNIGKDYDDELLHLVLGEMRTVLTALLQAINT